MKGTPSRACLIKLLNSMALTQAPVNPLYLMKCGVDCSSPKKAMVASVQTSSKGINQIAEDTVAPIQLQVKRTNDPMVIIRAKGRTQKPSRNIIIRTAAYDTVRKRTFLPLQDMKRETMMILQQKKVKLANEDVNTRRNPNSTLGIYLTATKVSQCR